MSTVEDIRIEVPAALKTVSSSVPIELYNKIVQLVAETQIRTGKRTTINSLVAELLQDWFDGGGKGSSAAEDEELHKARVCELESFSKTVYADMEKVAEDFQQLATNMNALGDRVEEMINMVEHRLPRTQG